MNSQEIFKTIYQCLTNGKTPEIICIAKEQKLEKNKPIHLHNGFEIRMLLSDDGRTLTYIDITPPRICHHSLNPEDNCRAHVLRIDENIIFYHHKTSGLQPYFSSPYKEQLLQGLNTLAKEPDSAICKEECRLLLSLFYLRASSAITSANANDRAQLFEQYLQNCYYQHDLSIVDTADRFGISPGYIQQIFRKKYNINPKDYLLKIRMENAVKLLSEHRYYIFEVASLCGFSDAHYFSEVFRRYYGISPRKYAVTNSNS